MRLLVEGYDIFIDEEDLPLFLKGNWVVVKNGHYNYLNRYESKRNKKFPVKHMIAFHRELLGITDSNILIDHVNRNGLDNRKSNLRIATRSTNAMNSKKRIDGITSKYKGVCFDRFRNKWRAYIFLNNKQVWSARFDNEHDAALARDLKCKELHKEFAVLNSDLIKD